METGIVTILGSGGSGGVPLVTGYWGECDPKNPKNQRLRASIALKYKDTCLVIDTGPDFRTQTLNNNIKNITAVLYSHAHSDHVNGIDELRYLRHVQDHMIDAYGDLETLNVLQARFSHVFTTSPDGLYAAVVNPIAFRDSEYGAVNKIGDIEFIPFYQTHGPSGRSVGYRFGDFAYSTDVSALDDFALTALKGIDTWVVDCAQLGSEYTLVHPNLETVIAWNERVGAKRVILTHLTPRLDYAAVTDQLPPGYEVAYDGMEINFRPK